jgi:hypothetical protein
VASQHAKLISCFVASLQSGAISYVDKDTKASKTSVLVPSLKGHGRAKPCHKSAVPAYSLLDFDLLRAGDSVATSLLSLKYSAQDSGISITGTTTTGGAVLGLLKDGFNQYGKVKKGTVELSFPIDARLLTEVSTHTKL